jgi:hypothetical protein
VERKHVQLLDIPKLYEIVHGNNQERSKQNRL